MFLYVPLCPCMFCVSLSFRLHCVYVINFRSTIFLFSCGNTACPLLILGLFWAYSLMKAVDLIGLGSSRNAGKCIWWRRQRRGTMKGNHIFCHIPFCRPTCSLQSPGAQSAWSTGLWSIAWSSAWSMEPSSCAWHLMQWIEPDLFLPSHCYYDSW